MRDAGKPTHPFLHVILRGIVWISLSYLCSVAFISFFSWNTTHPDVDGYLAAARRLTQGLPLYVSGEEKRFLYPPAAAAMFVPFTLVPAEWGYALWMTLHLIAAALFFVVLSRLWRFETKRLRENYLAIICLTLLVPLVSEIQEGQVNLFWNLIFASGLLAILRGKQRTAGGLFAIAAHLKLFPIVLLPVLICCRRGRAACWMCLSLIALVFLPVLWLVSPFGFVSAVEQSLSYNSDFGKAIIVPAITSTAVGVREEFYVTNNSLPGVLSRNFRAGVTYHPFRAVDAPSPLIYPLSGIVVHGIIIALTATLSLAVALLCWRKRGAQAGIDVDRGMLAEILLYYVAVNALEIVSPTMWEHHLICLAPLLPIALGTGQKNFVARTICWLGIALLFLTLTIHFWISPLQAIENFWDLRLLMFSRLYGLPLIGVALITLSGGLFVMSSNLPPDTKMAERVAD